MKRYSFDWLDDVPRNAHEDRNLIVRPKITGEAYHEMMVAHLPIVKVGPRDPRRMHEINMESRRMAFGRRK